MDIWEANSVSAAYTPHTCTVTGQYRCTGTSCGIQPANRYGGVCDPDGCDFNSYRMGDTTFYGPGMVIDTTQTFTVVTQFITSDGTATGTLSEIKRYYVQGGKLIPNSFSNFAGFGPYNSITDAMCTAKATLFGDSTGFETKGGLAAMGNSLATGMVLVLSLWDDYAVNMLWLDSDYPTTKAATSPGVARGTCATSSGAPAAVEAASPNAFVTYANIKWGDINSTYTGTTTSTTGTVHTTTTTGTVHTTTTTAHTTTTTGSSSCSAHWGQCAGMTYTGPTCCVSPYTCTFSNPWYSQCL
jgi:cellulose 1,4-beta-cellobiosidase